MARSNLIPFGKLFLCTLSAFGLACFSLPAYAQQNVAAGCNATVWNAMTAKAEAQVAYDVSVTRTLIDEPHSVLTLTCFDQAAGVSATKGGAIFSSDFTAQLSTVTQVNGGGTYNCTQIGDLWNQIATGGINTNAPYATFEDLVNGTVPVGAAGDYPEAWGVIKSAGIFDNLKNAVTALPQVPQAMDFSGAKSSCDVLKIAKIINSSCAEAGGQ